MVVVTLDVNLDLASDVRLLDDGLAFGDFQGLALAVDLDFDGHSVGLVLALGPEHDLVHSGQDFNNLGGLGTGDALGQDSDRDHVGAVLEEEVLAVVQLVLVGPVVEGSDVGLLDPAGWRQHVVGELLGDLDLGPLFDTEGKESVEGAVLEAEVLDADAEAGVFDGGVSAFAGSLEVNLNLDLLVGAGGRGFVNADAADEEGLEDPFNLKKDRPLLGLVRQLDLELELVEGGGLVAGLHAEGSQDLVLFLELEALLELGRLSDRLLLFFRLFKAEVDDELLLVVLAAVPDLVLALKLEGLLQKLLGVPDVVDLRVGDPRVDINFVLSPVIELDHQLGEPLDDEAVILSLYAQDQTGLDGMLVLATLDGSLEIDLTDLTVLSQLPQLLDQDVVVLDELVALLLQLLASVGLGSVAALADVQSLLADLGGLLALLAVVLVVEVQLLADLFSLPGDDLQVLELLAAALGLVRVGLVVVQADLLDEAVVEPDGVAITGLD